MQYVDYINKYMRIWLIMNINDKCEYIYQTPSTDHATFLIEL